MNIIQIIADEINIKENKVLNTVKLLDEGNTVPFIARYRKEMTGELDESIIREIESKLDYIRNLENRKQEVIRLIDEQEKLTKELEEKIKNAKVLQEVEDLYRPYRPKRRTRASMAKEKGLEPLAEAIFEQEMTEEKLINFALSFVDEEKDILSVDDAIQGAQDIIAEWVSDNAQYRQIIRELTIKEGILTAEGKESQKSEYEIYYDYKEHIKTIPPYRILAINRGEREKILSVKIAFPEEKLLNYLKSQTIKKVDSTLSEYVLEAVEDAYKRLISPSIEREIRNSL
ncbi:MAG TPA: RNA-binding transcriptional accessory protein, partial [Thermoanaerobacterales bacterium]|nr:RNA-binding transcriptional accessory protein [Thermoanaerobacterales bacterium]